MSPVSVDGSDWSGINQYQKTDAPFSPTFSNRDNLATPPTSGAPSAPNSVPNGSSSSQMSDSGNPSPPSSVAARSSDGTLADQRSKRHKRMEELLGQHYVALRRFLQMSYRDDRGNSKSSKARDKLLRLSATQFHELSTDVYDELLRRQQSAPSPSRPSRPDVPPFLPPRKDFHEKRNQARQKLASLQHQRFRDLATDVYCELERRFPQFPARESRRASPAPSARSRPSNGYPPGPYGPGFPPPPGSRRSQSRGPPRGRGYTSGGPPGGSFPPRQGSLGGLTPSVNGDGPMAKSFQSNTMVPNKSTMVEDDDDMAGMDDDYDARSDAFALDAVLQSRRGTTTTLGDGDRKLLADTQSQVSTLQDKVNKLEELLKTKDEEIAKHQGNHGEMSKLEELIKSKDEEISRYQEEQDKSQISTFERQEWEDIKMELESKISKAENLNSSLQLELDKVRMEQEAMEKDLRTQIDAASQQGAGDAELQARFADLEVKHRGLQSELQEQQQVTEEVRREAAGFLMEMRALSEQSHSRWEHEERLSGEVHRLEEEIKQWKSRYAKAKSQLRHLRASSAGISETIPDANTVARDNELLHENGLIKDIHVTKFQISIDELLRVARFDDHQLVMQQIKAVVIAVRHLLRDVEVSSDLDDGPSALRASKNFASSSGLSPVSLLDAAASHLSTAVIELLHLVKIQASPAGDLDEDEEEQHTQMKSPDYFSVAPSQRRLSNNGSVYSAMSPPSNHSGNPTDAHIGVSEHVPNGVNNVKVNYVVQPEDHELQELKLYVEDQTDGLVQSIQALVASIRGEEGLTTIRTHVSAISSVVTNVVSSAEHFIHKPDISPVLMDRAGSIIETLDYHRGRLLKTAAEGKGASYDEIFHNVTNKLPPIAFEIARVTKELVQRLDRTDYDDTEDDFR
ncbi:hypothetical protein EYZ11_012942 [Aspergillus tanneri]|uniref:GIT Spa2 homology (SHD) domain-containing protein n=1 Tax=Aspergillus tanneri TaxID=1220188 RepID=A0A4S3J4B6_9EURO|nr:hypothetical protein EYZ11_012942 [Aspergillus tanneri]